MTNCRNAHTHTHRACRKDANSLNFDLSTYEEGIDLLQLQPVFVLQHMSSVHSHLMTIKTQTHWGSQSFFIKLLSLPVDFYEDKEAGDCRKHTTEHSSYSSSSYTLNASFKTRKMISNAAPTVKGIWYRISSLPQRSFCSVLQTIHGERPNLGLKWNATSARGFTLLPHVKSTWNLQERKAKVKHLALQYSVGPNIFTSYITSTDDIISILQSCREPTHGIRQTQADKNTIKTQKIDTDPVDHKENQTMNQDPEMKSNLSPAANDGPQEHKTKPPQRHEVSTGGLTCLH